MKNVSKPAHSVAPADTEDQAADFEINRRLTEFVLANAVTEPLQRGTAPASSKVSVVGHWLALLALIPLLGIAWLYSALYEKSDEKPV